MGVLRVDLHCVLLTHRFLVVIDMLKPENLESSSVLQGCSYMDVPSSAKKDYQLTFLSYKEGVFRAKVSEDTGLQGPSRSCWLTEKLHASSYLHVHRSYEIPHVLSVVLCSSSVGAHSHSWKQGAELSGLFWVCFHVWNEQPFPFCLI